MPHEPTFSIGRYWGRVTHQRLGETKSGNFQLVLSFNVVGMVNLSDPEGDLLACPKAERSFYRVLTENTLDYAKQDMDTLEWFGSKWSQFDEESPDFVSVLGKELAFYCKHEQRQVKDEETGKWVATSELREVWSIAQASGPVVKPLDNTASRKLDALFGRALKDRKRPEQQPQASRAKPLDKMTPGETKAEAAAVDDSQVPF